MCEWEWGISTERLESRLGHDTLVYSFSSPLRPTSSPYHDSAATSSRFAINGGDRAGCSWGRHDTSTLGSYFFTKDPRSLAEFLGGKSPEIHPHRRGAPEGDSHRMRHTTGAFYGHVRRPIDPHGNQMEGCRGAELGSRTERGDDAVVTILGSGVGDFPTGRAWAAEHLMTIQTKPEGRSLERAAGCSLMGRRSRR